MMAAPAITPPTRRADEATWELLRDEWELLLAIGSGPTAIAKAAERVGVSTDEVGHRVSRLTSGGLVEEMDEGWRLVPAVYERQEAMSSYLRELVLDRIALGAGAPPLAVGLRLGEGDRSGLRAIHAAADGTALAETIALASAPESEDGLRFVAVYAATTLSIRPTATSHQRLVDALRGAAIQRARGEAEGLARMWVAEMRVAPEVALAVAEKLEAFVCAQSADAFGGALVGAVWAAHAPAAPGGSP
jgi:hypothetical protein